MSNSKKIKSKIKTILSIGKVTQAIHSIATVKLQKNKLAFNNVVSFKDALESCMHEFISRYDIRNDNNVVQNFFINKSQCHLIILITSDRGFCGNFNHEIISCVIKVIALSTDHIKIITIGKKGYNALKMKYEIYSNFEVGQDVDIIASLVSEKIIDMVNCNTIGKCTVYSYDFKNIMTQSIVATELMPMNINHSRSYPGYVIEDFAIVQMIVAFYLKSKIYYLIVAHKVCEEATRVCAMDDATNNIKKIIFSTTMELNKLRQNMITNELNEVISGTESTC